MWFLISIRIKKRFIVLNGYLKLVPYKLFICLYFMYINERDTRESRQICKDEENKIVFNQLKNWLVVQMIAWKNGKRNNLVQ